MKHGIMRHFYGDFEMQKSVLLDPSSLKHGICFTIPASERSRLLNQEAIALRKDGIF